MIRSFSSTVRNKNIWASYSIDQSGFNNFFIIYVSLNKAILILFQIIFFLFFLLKTIINKNKKTI